jgi:hypothetical protein
MFVLNPSGAGAGAGSPGLSGSDGGWATVVQQNVVFFGQLGIYFALIRAAHLYFASQQPSGSSSNQG